MDNSSILDAKAALPDRALELIGAKEEGLLQSDLWKLLGIESSRCSRIVSKLERSGLIRRHSISARGYRTFLLRVTAPRRKEGNNFCHIDTYLTEIYLLYLMRGSVN